MNSDRAPASPHERGSVSVAIKAYNHAGYVDESIASVLAQSFQDFEIVVTDDASTATANVIACFSDPRIRARAPRRRPTVCAS
jgi:glycosyltransferase involved in cell wall biosynthesis